MIELERMINHLENEYHTNIYISEKGCDYINNFQEMITRERIVIRDEQRLVAPGFELQLTNDNSTNAFSTKIDDEYCIFVNKGIIEEQRGYLEKYNWEFISNEEQKAGYIDDIIEYGFYFIASHEYAHIFCGHVDAGLSEANDKIAQECEADMFAMDYLVKYIEFSHSLGEITNELEKLFFAVYFLFQNMQRQNYKEVYNDRLIQNYYDDDRIQQRDHPLDAQRIMYLYDMLNIVIVTDKIHIIPIKDSIIRKLRILKRIKNNDVPKRELEYQIANDSIQKIKDSIKVIREKIPRVSNTQ